MMTFKRLARTKQLLKSVNVLDSCVGFAYYARGKESPSSFITSAMQIVADLETPTRQCTRVAPPSALPVSVYC